MIMSNQLPTCLTSNRGRCEQIARGATWFTATVTGVDLQKNEVEYKRPDGARATLSYAQLVLACGSAVNLDEVPGIAAHAHTLRTVGDGFSLGNEVIARFEPRMVLLH